MTRTLALGCLALAAVLVGGCGGSAAAPPCGWDTSTPDGQRAMTERLDVVASWLVDHPGEAPPPIDSPYWLGECPTSTQGPPIHEDEGQGHDGDQHDDEPAGVAH